MEEYNIQQLIDEIELGKRHLMAMTRKYHSFVHQKVLKESQALDTLIARYLKLTHPQLSKLGHQIH